MHYILNFILIVGLVTACGSERSSHPDIRGEWILAQTGKERVRQAESYGLKITDNRLELRHLSTGLPVAGGSRSFYWSGNKIVIEPQAGLDGSTALVLSATGQRLEFASLFAWPRAGFKRVTPDEWAVLVKPPEPKEPEDTNPPALLALEKQLQGVWEKGENQPPFANLGLVVEIGNGQIRGQDFLYGYRHDLLGRSRPCEYELKSTTEAVIRCPETQKSYPMQLSFETPHQLNVKIMGFDLVLFRSIDQRVTYLSKKFRVQLRRLDAQGVLSQTKAEGVSPKP